MPPAPARLDGARPLPPEPAMRPCSLLLLLLAVPPAVAQPKTPDQTLLTLDRIFGSDEFRGDRVPAVKWLDGGGYTTLQPSKARGEASDIVRFDAAGKRTVLVPAEKLVPPGAKE